MPIQMIDEGSPFTMIQNVVYAVPPHNVYRFTISDDGTATFQAANDSAFTTPVSVSPGSGGADLARQFIRCTNKNVTVQMVKGA